MEPKGNATFDRQLRIDFARAARLGFIDRLLVPVKVRVPEGEGTVSVQGMAVKIVLKELDGLAGTKDISWPSQELLAARCSMTVATLNRALRYLRHMGWLETRQEYIPAKRRTLTCYRLVWTAIATAAESPLVTDSGRADHFPKEGDHFPKNSDHFPRNGDHFPNAGKQEPPIGTAQSEPPPPTPSRGSGGGGGVLDSGSRIDQDQGTVADEASGDEPDDHAILRELARGKIERKASAIRLVRQRGLGLVELRSAVDLAIHNRSRFREGVGAAVMAWLRDGDWPAPMRAISPIRPAHRPVELAAVGDDADDGDHPVADWLLARYGPDSPLFR